MSVQYNWRLYRCLQLVAQIYSLYLRGGSSETEKGYWHLILIFSKNSSPKVILEFIIYSLTLIFCAIKVIALGEIDTAKWSIDKFQNLSSWKGNNDTAMIKVAIYLIDFKIEFIGKINSRRGNSCCILYTRMPLFKHKRLPRQRQTSVWCLQMRRVVVAYL